MVIVNAEQEVGVKTTGPFVDFYNIHGVKFLEIEVSPMRVEVSPAEGEEYVTVFASGGPVVAAGLADVRPTREGWTVEAFGYRVEVAFKRDYAELRVSHAVTGKAVAKLTVFEEQEEV